MISGKKKKKGTWGMKGASLNQLEIPDNISATIPAWNPDQKTKEQAAIHEPIESRTHPLILLPSWSEPHQND